MRKGLLSLKPKLRLNAFDANYADIHSATRTLLNFLYVNLTGNLTPTQRKICYCCELTVDVTLGNGIKLNETFKTHFKK